MDIPTNPHGNTMDLAFKNMPLALATIEDHLATSSDYFALSITIPELTPTLAQLGKIRVSTDTYRLGSISNPTLANCLPMPSVRS